MPAAERFSITNRAVLQRILDAANQGDWQGTYQAAIDALTAANSPNQPIPGVDPQTYVWLLGAKQVNDNYGGFASFIRDFAMRQYELRSGFMPDNPEVVLQATSDRIIEMFVRNLFGVSDNDPLPTIAPDLAFPPTLHEVGLIDGGAAVAEMFVGAATSTGLPNYSPWPGATLFVKLGDTSFFDNWVLDLGTSDFKQEAGTYDLVAAAQVTVELKTVGLVLDTVLTGGLPTYLQTLIGGLDESLSLALKTKEFFIDAYGLDAVPIPIGAQIFSDIAGGLTNIISGLTLGGPKSYRIGTVFDDSGPKALILDRDNDVVNSGAGDDIIVVPNLWALSGSLGGAPIILDGSIGYDTVDYSRMSTAIRVNFDEQGAFGTRAVISKSGLLPLHRDALYNIEHIILTAASDHVAIGDTDDISGITLELGGGQNIVHFVDEIGATAPCEGGFNLDFSTERGQDFFWFRERSLQTITIDRGFDHALLQDAQINVNGISIGDGSNGEAFRVIRSIWGQDTLIIDWQDVPGDKDLLLSISGWKNGDFGVFLA